MTDMGTQTDYTAETLASKPTSEHGRNSTPEPLVEEPEEIDSTVPVIPPLAAAPTISVGDSTYIHTRVCTRAQLQRLTTVLLLPRMLLQA